MRYDLPYSLDNYTKADIEVLNRSFIPHLKDNAVKGKTTLNNVYGVTLTPVGSELKIDISIESDADEKMLYDSIHGGLGKALGKGRVTKRDPSCTKHTSI